MADSENDGAEEEIIDPATLLKRVEKQAKTNKLLFTVVLAISGLIITVMATGMTVMFLKLSALTSAAEASDEDAMDEQFMELEQQLMLVADFRKSELKKIKAYTKQLDNIANDCSLEKAAPYRDFLAGREKDFQIFLTSVKSGTTSLAGMVKGSRQWLDAHNRELEELKQLSVIRQDKINNLSKSATISGAK